MRPDSSVSFNLDGQFALIQMGPHLFIKSVALFTERHMAEQVSRILRVAEVCKRTGLCRVTIHNLRHRNDFPEPLKLSPGAVGWLEHEVDEWIARRAAERRVA